MRAGFAAPLAALRSKPNVILFVTDDHGAWAMGQASGGTGLVKTPNLDRLAQTGTRFENAFAATPVCSPSRMTMLTGKLPSAHGVQDYLEPRDCTGPESRRWLDGHLTFTEVLARRGYDVGLCGKWHMGGDDAAHAGFRYWRATVGSAYRDPEVCVDGKRERRSGFTTDVTADAAIDFLEQKRRDPFFLMVAFNAPHTPYDFQPEEDRAAVDLSLLEEFPEPDPVAQQNPQLREHFGRPESVAAYAALVAGVDRNVGRVLAALDRLNLRRDTTVVFTSDQGWNAGQDGVWGKGNGTIPFNLLDGSVRVPMIWNQPGRVGRSYAGAMHGDRMKRWTDRVYFEYAYTRGVRTHLWKYVERAEGWPTELFCMQMANGERVNALRRADYQRWASDLREDLGRFFDRAGAPPLSEWRRTTRQQLPVYPTPVGVEVSAGQMPPE
jgi:arylsulfatase A-like enzyme